MRTVAILQARMGSTRLPGKALLPLGARPVLSWVIERVKLAAQVQLVAVATSDNPADEAIVQLCSAHGTPCFRGSEHDVLKRFVEAAKEFQADQIIRVNGDNPFVDPLYVDVLCREIASRDAEYVSYATNAGQPVMLTALSFFTEAVSCQCLLLADREISSPFTREHVTLGIYQDPMRCRVRFLPVPDWCNDPRLRFTLDTHADLELLHEIVAAMGPDACSWPADRIVQLVRHHPDWLARMDTQNQLNRKEVQPSSGQDR